MPPHWRKPVCFVPDGPVGLLNSPSVIDLCKLKVAWHLECFFVATRDAQVRIYTPVSLLRTVIAFISSESPTADSFPAETRVEMRACIRQLVQVRKTWLWNDDNDKHCLADSCRHEDHCALSCNMCCRIH